MALTLRPATPSDIPSLVSIFFDGFASHPPTQRIFPAGTAPAEAYWLDGFSSDIKDPKVYLVVVEDASTTPHPTVVGFAKWSRHPATEKPPFFSPLADDNWPVNGDRAMARSFFGTLHDKHEKIMGGREHWYLELIATRTGWQRRGLGGMLVRWGLERADAEGWEAYLDATPEGRGLYERLGFGKVWERDWPEVGYFGHQFMVRERRARE
ncbi:acetyltransferas-like protein [Coniochaeta sp. 2T2.1]|nr:acetyltransferas-like protein [Coniochaeta sp. 2T2.1]